MWMTTKQIQDLFGISRPAVYKKAIKEGWLSKIESTPTGKVKYFDVVQTSNLSNHIESNKGYSPLSNQNKVSNRVKKEVSNCQVSNSNQVSNLPELSNCEVSNLPEVIHGVFAVGMIADKEKIEFEASSKDNRDRAFARLSVVKAFKAEKLSAKLSGNTVERVAKKFIEMFNSGIILSSESKLLGKVSLPTVYRWAKQSTLDAHYPVHLLDNKQGNCGRKSEVMDYIHSEIKMLAVDPRNHNAYSIYRIVKNNHPIETPNYRTVQKLVQKARADVYLTSMVTGPSAYRNNAKPHIKRINDAYPSLIWESDGHTVNVLVKSPFWFHQNPRYRVVIRPQLIAFRDVATGLITGWCLAVNENFHAIKTAFVDGVSKYGVPVKVRTDNGRAYKNLYTVPEKFLKGKTVTARKANELINKGFKGFYQSFGVEEVHFTKPGNPESKNIEASWNFCLAPIEKLFWPYSGGKIGKRPEDLQKTNKELIKNHSQNIPTWEEFTHILDEYIREYNNTVRKVLVGHDGQEYSPEDYYKEIEPKRLTRQEIEHHSWYPETYTVTKEGIYVNGNYYLHPCFGAYLGQKMAIEYDERDLAFAQIATSYGEKLSTPAVRKIPGSNIDNEQTARALMQNSQYEKAIKQVYLEMQNTAIKGVKGANIALETVNELVTQQGIAQDNDKAKLLSFNPTNPKPKREKEPVTQATDSFAEAIAEVQQLNPNTSLNKPVKVSDEDALIDDFLKDLKAIGL